MPSESQLWTPVLTAHSLLAAAPGALIGNLNMPLAGLKFLSGCTSPSKKFRFLSVAPRALPICPLLSLLLMAHVGPTPAPYLALGVRPVSEVHLYTSLRYPFPLLLSCQPGCSGELAGFPSSWSPALCAAAHCHRTAHCALPGPLGFLASPAGRCPDGANPTILLFILST